MKTSLQTPEKLFSQKGQGLVEYALLFSFVGAIFVFVFANGDFRASINNVFNVASNNLGEAGETSFDYENLDDVLSETYPPLNWPQVNSDFQHSYNVIMNSDTVDKALTSEVNLFGALSTMAEGHLASLNPEDGTKDWENFLSSTASAQAQNNFTSSYNRGEETIQISRLGNSNTLQARWSDGKDVYYWRLSPDANNVMQVETNSNKNYSEFFSTIVNSKGWEYGS